MTNIRQYKITFKNIKEGEIPCDNPTIKLLGVSDGIVQKCEFKNNSVTFSIFEDAIDGLQGKCINFTILCETCGKCKPKPGKLCFCNDFTDCEECQDCINGVCVNRCPDMLCVDGRCQDCGDPEDCQGNLECIGGKCGCPPTLPYYDEVAERCYGCQNDNECGPCYRCIDGNCVRLNCICDEDTDSCVECLSASDCGVNECCIGHKCECCPGYIWDPINEICVPKPPCLDDDDLEPCQMCVNGVIVDIVCPDPNQICINGECVDIPCEGPCDDATDCGPDCGCLNGECVDCASLDCVTCAQTIGCKCVTGNCEKDDSPCAQYSCDTNCGDRPDCECQEDGSCKEKECEGESTLEKNEDNCQLVYNLETSECCPCADITLDNKIISASINIVTSKITLTSLVEARKGTVTTPLGILDLHRVDEEQYDDIMDNEEPTQGQVQVIATYTYRAIPSGIETVEVVNLTPIFDIAGTGYSQQLIQINIPGYQYPTGLRILKSVTLTYKLISELTFESGCTYNEDTVIGTYTFDESITPIALVQALNINTAGEQSNAEYWLAKTLTSSACRNPEAKWYKAVANTNGSISTFETVPFRKAYLTKLTLTTYTDFIDEPDENPGPTDNNGELFSGYYYKVATDCACTNEATAYYASTCQDPGRLVFCDPAEASVTFDACGKSFTFNTAFVTDCLPNYDYYGDNADFVSDAAQLRYSIHVNGSDTPLLGSTVIANSSGVIYNEDQEFTSSELIGYIEIRFSHDNCDECTIRVDSDVNLDLPTYTIICEPSGSTDVTYTITFTFPAGVDEIIVGSNTATSGSPTISITLANTIQEIEMEIVRTGCGSIFDNINLPENCCDDLTVSLTQDSTNCSASSYNFVAVANPAIGGSYGFYVNNVFAENNTDGLFSTLKNVGGTNEPNSLKVVFTPTSGLCNTVQRTISIDKTFGFSLISAGGSPVAVCSIGATSTNIVYSVPAGVTGNVTYSITGAGATTVAVNGPTPLTINVPGTPTETKVLTIDSNTLVDGTGNGCATFTPAPVTINFVTSPSISGITALPADPCEEATVTVTINGTAGAIATVNISNIIGTWTGYPNMTVGVPYTVTAGTAGNLTVNATNVATGGCSVPASASTTIVVKDKPEVTSIVSECTTPGNPASTIDFTILGTAGSVVQVNAFVIPETSPGNYFLAGLPNSLGGTSATITITKTGCSDSQTFAVESCACADTADVTIKLGGIAITTDSGCEGDTSTYTTTLTDLNGGETYAWYLDAVDTGTLLGTNSSLLYTFDDATHVLYVKVTDNQGCIVTDSITVEGFPLPVFTLNVPATLCLGEVNNITYTITEGTVTSRQWKLDGVNVSTSAVYAYTPADLLNHTVSLTITTTDGCVDTVTDATVQAVDCCDVCTEQTVNVIAGEPLQWMTTNSALQILIPGGETFECADPSVDNDAAVAAMELALTNAGDCGTPAVTWTLIDDATDCKKAGPTTIDPSNAITGGFMYFKGVTINGTYYATTIDYATYTGGVVN